MPINCFATTSGSTTVTVNIANHGAINTAYVSFSGATAVGGVPASDLNKEHQVSNVTSSSFTITVSTTASSTVSAGGGSAIIAEFQVNPGLDTVVPGNGWGAGTWGRGTWGSASTSLATSDVLRLWSHDNFGEDLIINIRNGGIFYWDRTNGVSSRAIPLHSLTGADSATPQVAKKVLVSDRDRHVIAFGCDAIGSIGTVDPLLIRFSDQETPTTWLPTATNTAGDLRISSGSEIVTAVETKQQMLVFTDVSLHAMQFLGPPFTFGLGILSENTTIIAPNAAIAVDDIVFWMGEQDFYIYTGAVQKLPCTVLDYVFSDFNLLQKEKVFTAINSSFGEVWWFYPSSTATEIDRYVIYNYEQKIWYIGNLERTAWVDRGIRSNPIAASSTGHLFFHEDGFDDGSTTPQTGITAFIESSQQDIQDGNDFVFLRRLIPDITFRNSSTDAPSAIFTLKARNFPGATYSNTDDSTVTQSASVPIELFTNQAHVRLRGRSFALRVESTATGTGWRLGSPRVDIRPDGSR
jgi:hypothetical protein|tara:strand:- start:187 stop:1752 length:1566 start_codon:yes stop_codon:yes gene_type:complete